MAKTSWKHDIFWYCLPFAFVAGLSVGGFLGAISTKEHGRTDPIVRYELRIIHEPPIQKLNASNLMGKRSSPGALAPETLRAIELQSAKEIFNSGCDPFGL